MCKEVFTQGSVYFSAKCNDTNSFSLVLFSNFDMNGATTLILTTFYITAFSHE